MRESKTDSDQSIHREFTVDHLAELLESACNDVGLRLDCKTAMLDVDHATPTMHDLILAARERCAVVWNGREQGN